MPTIVHALNFILMIVLPILLGVFIARKFGAPWSLFFIGAATFIASQVVHIPLNIGLTTLFQKGILPAPPKEWTTVFNAVVLGLTAGLCEESARYVVYRWWITSARTWRQALMFGAGHGGVEAIIFGALAGLAFINMVVLKGTAPAALPVPINQQALAAKQIADYWAMGWSMSLLGAVERAFTLCFHISAAVLVLQAVKRRNLLWLIAAILWHTTLNVVALLVLAAYGPYWSEATVGVLALVSLGLIFALRPTGDDAPPPEPVITLPSTAAAPVVDAESELRRKMDDSQFTE
jgi:uncharacterized membrane protein YhfC